MGHRSKCIKDANRLITTPIYITTPMKALIEKYKSKLKKVEEPVEYRSSPENKQASLLIRETKAELYKAFIADLESQPPPVAEGERTARVQGFAAGIPWSIHLRAYDAYAKKYSNGQSPERLHERGGFRADELDTFIPGWREEVSEIGRLKEALVYAETDADHERIMRNEEAERFQSREAAQAKEVERLKAEHKQALCAMMTEQLRWQEDFLELGRQKTGMYYELESKKMLLTTATAEISRLKEELAGKEWIPYANQRPKHEQKVEFLQKCGDWPIKWYRGSFYEETGYDDYNGPSDESYFIDEDECQFGVFEVPYWRPAQDLNIPTPTT